MKKNKIKKTALLIIILALNMVVFAQSPDWVWAKSAGGSGQDKGAAVCTDKEGNILITGYFNSTATFGDTTVTSSGLCDFYVAKYNQAGEFLWVRTAFGGSYDEGNAVTTDNDNNIYVTGTYINNITFGSFSLSNYSSTYDIFIAKYNKDGVVVWAKKIGSTGADMAYAIRADHDDNIIVAGSIQPTAYFDSISVANSDLGSHTLFIAKYTPAGKILFVRNFGGHLNFAKCVAIDSDNNIIVGGSYDRTIVIGGTSYTAPTSTYAPVLIKMTANGNVAWSAAPVVAAGSTSNSINGIAVGPGNDVLVTGVFNTSISFGTATLTSSGKLDGFVCTYDSSGKYKWGSAFGGYEDDAGAGICYYGNQVVVTGFSKLVSTNGKDIVINKYEPDGSFKESIVVGGLGDDIGRAATFDNFGNLFLTGDFATGISFGSLSLSGTGYEIFLAKFGLAKPPSIVILQHPNNVSKCLGESTIFHVQARGNNLDYQWKHNGIVIPNAIDTFLVISNLDLADAGKYRCTVSDSAFSISSNEATLTVGVEPFITAQPQNKTVEKGKSVTFTVTATGDQLTYKWQKNGVDINGATQSSYTKSNVQYSDSGLYTCIITGRCGIDTSNGAKLKVTPNTGMEELNGQGILMYPNPASKIVYLQFPNEDHQAVAVSIYEAGGKLIMEAKAERNAGAIQSLNLEGFNKGIYIVRISTSAGIFTKLLCVN